MSIKHLKRFEFRPIPKDPPVSLMAYACLFLIFVLVLLELHAPLIERIP